jgi:ABC-type bacteriocin/lantibiotic exporter with double-glycine peptidase domain
VPKFVVDMALIGGFLVIGGAAWLVDGQQGALGAVAIFSIAGFKIIPGITRAQNFATTIHANVAFTTTVVADINDAKRYEREAQELGRTPMPATPQVLRLSGVEFTYPGAERPAVTDIDLTVPIGTSVALVGSSGAGKSTLIDLLLGLLVPSCGTIDVDGLLLSDVLKGWRSRVGYVPQDVTLFDGTIAQNVALTWSDDVDDARVEEALARAQLLDVVRSRPNGIHGRVGERGLTLSGGQRQRLGIARALYVQPLVLVLDEATSALDTATEEAVAAAVREMHGDVTVVSVAHRLSTIRHSDQVCFMKDGTIVSRGSFDEVVRSSSDFAEQARLSGLVRD